MVAPKEPAGSGFHGLPGDVPALAELMALPRWVVWRYEARDGGKSTKVPYMPGGGFHASVDRPSNWSTYRVAERCAIDRGFDGVGIVLVEADDIFAIDLDACIADGVVAPWARKILDMAETYAEVTPSGCGLRLIGRGEAPTIKADGIGVEIYSTGRYVTLTGHHVAGTPDAIAAAPRTLAALVARVSAHRSADATAGTEGERSPCENAYHDGPTSQSELEELLTYIPAACSYAEWISVGMALKAALGEAGLDAWDQWSATGGDAYPGRPTIARKWRSFKREGVTSASIAELARQHGADLSEIAFRHKVGAFPAADDGFDPDKLRVGSALVPVPPGLDEHRRMIVDRAAKPRTPDMPYPPGLVGDIARWITATARRPQPAMAIGAALVLVGTAAGRLYQGPEGAATHLYVLGLAPTGGGKDWPLRSVSRLLKLAGIEQHLGPSEFISMPAVVEFLKEKPLSVCCMDEFGDFMKRINHRRASGFEKSISKVLRSLWSLGYAPYATPQWAQKGSMTLHAPALSIFGASTPAQFYESMVDGSLEDGTMNRFIVVGQEERPPRQTPHPFDLEEAMTFAERLRAIYYVRGELTDSHRNDSSKNPEDISGGISHLPWGPGAKERYEAIMDEIEVEMDDPMTAPFLVRVGEQAVRIATIVALGREKDQVDVEELEWAYILAAGSASFMRAGAADYMAENEHQAALQKIVRLIRNRGGWVRQRDIARAIQTMKARDLKDALQQLVEAGEIEPRKVPPPARGGHVTYEYRAN